MGLSTFEIAIWVLTFFFTIYGTIFLILSNQSGARSANGTEDPSFLKRRLFLLLFSILYFSFAHYGAYTGIVLNIEYGVNPCATQINMTTSAGNLTSYSYYTSCNTSASEVLSAFQVTYGWLLWIELIVLMLGSLFLIIDRVNKKW